MRQVLDRPARSPRRQFGLALALSLALGASTADAKNRVITVVNNCDYTVWPAIFRSVGPMPKQKTGWEAKPGSRVGFEVEESWGGRVWGRTGCDFTKDVPEYLQCETGGCNGGLECNPGNGTGVLPVTLAEFNIQTEVDHYDTSNVDGFNIPMAVTNDADCPLSNCPYDLRESCPDKLQYKNDAGDVVGCLTDCGAEQQNEEYCCFGAHQLPENCPSTAIPNYPWWKKNCPIAYAYDESSGTALFTCSKQVNWMITFCPGPELYSSTATLPNGTEITQGGDYPNYPKGTAKDGGGAPAKAENESGSDKAPPASSSAGGGGGGSSTGGGSGGDSSPTSSEGGGTAASGGSSSSKPSSTAGSTGGGSTGGTSSSSSSSSSSDTSSAAGAGDDTLFGLPKSTVYIATGVAACLVIALVVFFAMRSGGGGGGGKRKKKTKSRRQGGGRSGSSSSSDSRGGGSTDTGSGSDASSSDDDGGGGGGRNQRSARALGKLRSMQEAEDLAVHAGLYGAAARRAGGLTALLGDDGERGRRVATADERRLFSLGSRRYSDSSDDGDRAAEERTYLARSSLAGV